MGFEEETYLRFGLDFGRFILLGGSEVGKKKINRFNYWQIPIPLHLPLDPEVKVQETLGLLGLEVPQKRLVAVPWHLGVLKQSVEGLPHLVWMFLNWQLTLQQEEPWKFPKPGSHCSPISTLALPQTGGRVTEGVPEFEGVIEKLAVPVTLSEGVTELVSEGEPDFVREIDCVPVPELVSELVTEFVLELELELVPETVLVTELVLEFVLVSDSKEVSVVEGEPEGETETCPLTNESTREMTKKSASEAIL